MSLRERVADFLAPSEAEEAALIAEGLAQETGTTAPEITVNAALSGMGVAALRSGRTVHYVETEYGTSAALAMPEPLPKPSEGQA